MRDGSDDQKRRESIALFRHALIGDLVHENKGLYAKLREKAERQYEIPFSRRRRVAVETLRDWVRAYRRSGFEGLLPKPRSDNGLCRALPRELCDWLVEHKDEHRELTVPKLIEKALELGKVPEGTTLAAATVHRILAQHGLNRAENADRGKDRRHFEYDQAGELWMSDVMHGPSVVVGDKKKRKTYLIGVIDDATRIVPYAAFALSENTASYLPVLEQAVLRRGVPKRLYVDNGAVFRTHHLAVVCARLGITLIHARPYQPSGKGKQERFFRTVRMRFLAGLQLSALTSVGALNRAFWTWVEGEYHHAPHRGLGGECPQDRWAERSGEVRVAPADIGELFLFEQKRKVHKDRTVSLDGVMYEVEAALVGETVLLRYDPHRKSRSVQVWHGGKFVQQAKVVDAYANCFVRRNRQQIDLDKPSEPAPGLVLSNFNDQEDE
jgi:transposase InsO family protein